MQKVKIHPAPWHAAPAPRLWQGCWAPARSHIRAYPEDPHLLHQVHPHPATQNLAFLQKLRKSSRKKKKKKKAVSKELPSLMCKSQLPKPEVNRWQRLLGVGKGSGWPFPEPHTAWIDAALRLASALHISICSSDGLPRCQSQIT